MGRKIIRLAAIGLIFCTLGSTALFGADGSIKGDSRYTFSSDWFSHNAPTWNAILGKLRDKADLAYLEVGVYEGRSFFWVLDNILTHPSSKAVAIDIFEDDLEQRFRSNLKRSGHEPRVTVLKGPSQYMLRDFKPNSFDLIYIDGDHKSKYVLVDAILAWDLLKDGGIMIFDDYKWGIADLPAEARPGLALDMFLTLFWDEAYVLTNSYQLILRKVQTGCDYSAGSVDKLGVTLFCSRLGPFLYYWKPQKLYDPSTKRERPLQEGDVPFVEEMLLRLGFGLTMEKIKGADMVPYRSLLDRLGIGEIVVPSPEKEWRLKGMPAKKK
jgi:predicted O-methyltransferase YrrM